MFLQCSKLDFFSWLLIFFRINNILTSWIYFPESLNWFLQQQRPRQFLWLYLLISVCFICLGNIYQGQVQQKAVEYKQVAGVCLAVYASQKGMKPGWYQRPSQKHQSPLKLLCKSGLWFWEQLQGLKKKKCRSAGISGGEWTLIIRQLRSYMSAVRWTFLHEQSARMSKGLLRGHVMLVFHVIHQANLDYWKFKSITIIFFRDKCLFQYNQLYLYNYFFIHLQY